jgi:tRNA pseudouridine13 synthase
MTSLPRAYGDALARGAIRTVPEDFVVEEQLGLEPDGTGEHMLVLVEKRGANTHWVARTLADFAGVSRSAVSYAGSKDRHAVARQWFSIWLAARPDPDWTRYDAEGVRVLSAARHRRKLRRGAHSGNAFRLRVRTLCGDTAGIEDRLRTIAMRGAPNYFGPQRYGHGNLRAAHELADGARLPRVQRGFALSAARSQLFDAVLAARVADRTWDRLVSGDAANLAGSASWFVVDAVDSILEKRVAELDVHPTGPLWGRGEPGSAGGVRERERAIAMAQGGLAAMLEHAGLEQARRALRLVPSRLTWQIDGDNLLLSFELRPGEYATTLLRELIEIEDRGGPDAADHEAC